MANQKRDIEYDPDQDLEEKRDIRRNYRNIRKNIEEPAKLTTEGAIEALDQTNVLFPRVRGINEATNDSETLLLLSKFGASQARAMKSGTGAFDVDDFIARLITYMGGRKEVSVGEDSDFEEDADAGPLDWERIARRGLAKSRRVPAMDFMLGPLSIEQKKRAVAKRSKLEKNKEDLRKPQEITEEDITRSENETTKNVATLEHILEGHESVNLFKFIVNPNDFGQSVENLFYLSFLIRDGKCALETSEEGEPMIMLCEQPTEADYEGGLRKRQLVLEFDMATWKRAIEVFNITETMIPQRAKAEMRIGQKWYG